MDFCVGVGMEAILRELRAAETKSKNASNILTSPSSLHFSLSIAASGATGRTSDQLLAALGCQSLQDLNSKALPLTAALTTTTTTTTSSPPPPPFQFHTPNSTSPHFNPRIPGAEGREPTVMAANGVWIDHESRLKPSFERVIREVYGAEFSYGDFGSQAERIAVEINSWAERSTKGLINQIIAPHHIRKELVLILVNAIYFKGFWSQPFVKSMTEDQDFHLLDGTRIKAPFMRDSISNHYYGCFDGFKVLKLPYHDNGGTNLNSYQKKKFAMFIFLPTAITLQEMLLRFCPYLGPMQNLELEKTSLEKVWIPKWKFSSLFTPTEIMQDLGLNLPFQRQGEFTEMVDGNAEKIYMNEVFQKACVEVDEEGTEAAAVTAMSFGSAAFRLPRTPKDDFVADRPFMFIVQEEVSRAVLFVGALLDPLNGSSS